MPSMFDLSTLNPVTDPWGPTDKIPDSLKFHSVPYAPFLKTDRLGKIADRSAVNEEQPQTNANKNRREKDQFHAYGASVAKMFGIDLDNLGFNQVDANNNSNNSNTVLKTKKQQKKRPSGFAAAVGSGSKSGNDNKSSNANKKQNSQNFNNSTNSNNNSGNSGNSNNTANSGNFNNNNNRWTKEPAFKREASIKVESNWKQVSEFELNKLSKLNLTVSKSEVVAQAGELHQYLKKYDNPRPTPLVVSSATTAFQTTNEDSVIKSLAADKKAKIFITDEILAQIMCASKSQYSWDIKITKKNGSIFFDKRPNTMRIEVDENTFNGPNDSKPNETNSSTMLSQEAKLINDSFLATSLSSSAAVKYNIASPVKETINRAYNYIRYELPHNGEECIPIIVRTVQDATINGKPITIHALNQYDSNDWCTKFQSGLIMVDEIKKNNNKISQWTTRALLAQCESMKLGFVSRQPNSKYTVASVTTQMTSHLADQINLSLNNGWGIIKSIIDIIEHEAGDDEEWEFIIFKLPNIQKLSIYKVCN